MGTVYYVCNFSTNLRLFQIKSLLKKKKGQNRRSSEHKRRQVQDKAEE